MNDRIVDTVFAASGLRIEPIGVWSKLEYNPMRLRYFRLDGVVHMVEPFMLGTFEDLEEEIASIITSQLQQVELSFE